MSVAIITGASGGIGGEFARQIKAGFPDVKKFWFVARNRERMEALASELQCDAKIISCDLADPGGLSELERELRLEKPEVSYLINCAGFGKFGAFDELCGQCAMDMIEVNVKALVAITYMAVPYMKRGGRIVELGSGSCFTPLPYFNVYSSSKVFVLHFTKSLNYELKKYGIRATCFCPGWVKTEFLESAGMNNDVTHPKATKPLLTKERVVKKCIKAMRRGRAMCVTGKYTKLQHLLFKLLPDSILTRAWLGMLEYPKKEKEI